MTTHEPTAGTAFRTIADPDIFFSNALYAETLGRLLLAVESREPLAVLTGEPGTGKTTMLRRVLRQVERTGLKAITSSVPMGLDDLRASLPAAEPDRRVAVGLDEAQALSDELLTALPSLLADRPDVWILLVGQPGLRERLAALEASGAPLPISVRCQLGPLAVGEVGPYIEYCWRKASSGPNPFPSSAVRRIARVSAGIPQIINSICRYALHLAEIRGQEMVSREAIDAAARAVTLGASRKPFAHRMTLVSPRSPTARAAIAVLVAIPLLIVGVDLLRRHVTRAQEGQVKTTATLRAEPLSIDPRAVASPPPESTPSEPVIARQPPPTRERQRLTTRSVASVARALPPPAPSVTPSVTSTRGEPAKDEALLRRSEEGDIQAVPALIAEGASPDARDASGLTPLMLVVIHDHSAIIDLLIARGANVNAQNRAGLTPLMFAAINNRPSALRTLVDRGANMNARTKAGWTALTYAAWQGDADIVRLLLARGADPNVTDHAGWTILQYASWRATQPASSADLSGILTGVEASGAMVTGSGHDEVIALLQGTAVKRDRVPASKPGSRQRTSGGAI